VLGYEADERSPGSGARQRQEQEVAVAHALAAAEYALAREGARVGRVLEEAGLAFDAHTFVALRILESSVEEDVDPVDALSTELLRGLVERSAQLTAGLLAAS